MIAFAAIRQPMPTHTTSYWKGNADIDSWFKEKKKKDRVASSKKTRQAMKDAQWVLDRREAQMKQIQRRNKMERSEEHQRAMQEEKERKLAKVLANRAAAGANPQQYRRSDTMTADADSPPAEGGEGHEGLLWRECPSSRITRRIPKSKEAAIWVMPGYFATSAIAA